MQDPGRQRLDKWLWCARVARQRETAVELVEKGQVRLNRQKVLKPGHRVGPGDMLTITAGGHVRVLEVVALAERRGGLREAQALYRDFTMPDSGDGAAQKEDATGTGNC